MSVGPSVFIISIIASLCVTESTYFPEVKTTSKFYEAKWWLKRFQY